MRRLLPFAALGVSVAAALAVRTARADESILAQPMPPTADQLPNMFDLSFQKPGEEQHVPFENIFQKASLDLNLRNYLFNRGVPDKADLISWAQGGSLKYHSGKIAGIVTLDAEYFTSYKLEGDDVHDGGLILEPSQNDIEVLGVAEARIDLGKYHVLSAYRQKLDLPYVNQQDNRMIANTFEAYTLAIPKTKNDRFQYAVGYIDQMKKRNSDHFISMSDAVGVQGQNNGLYFGGLRVFPIKELQIAAIDFYQEDILNYFYTEASHKIKFCEDFSNNLSAQYSDQSTVGDDLLRGDRYSSNFWGVQEAFGYNHAVLKVAYDMTDTGANMKAPFGSYPSYTSSIVEDFNRAGEQSWLIGLSYEFSRIGLKDLSISAAHISGSGAIDEITKQRVADKSETDVTIDYKPSEGFLENFWIRLRSGTVDQERGGTVQDFRVIVNYDIALYHPKEDEKS